MNRKIIDTSAKFDISDSFIESDKSGFQFIEELEPGGDFSTIVRMASNAYQYFCDNLIISYNPNKLISLDVPSGEISMSLTGAIFLTKCKDITIGNFIHSDNVEPKMVELSMSQLCSRARHICEGIRLLEFCQFEDAYDHFRLYDGDDDITISENCLDASDALSPFNRYNLIYKKLEEFDL